jgi:hypothetical protein
MISRNSHGAELGNRTLRTTETSGEHPPPNPGVSFEKDNVVAELLELVSCDHSRDSGTQDSDRDLLVIW